jgi:MarR family transcriptional regulator, organic hydroperoxide resistance regulator
MMSQHSEPPPLDFLLAQVSRLHHYRAHELLDGLGLYRGQPPVLFALWERDGLTHKELAGQLEITPATVTKMIQRMEKAGFVRRQPDASDQRVSRVYLTDAGRAVHAQVQAVWNRMEVENFAGFSDEERVTLRRFLLQIRDNLTRATDGKLPL